MLKLSKKAEYAILAMQYLAENPGEKLNAKEIASNLDLSFEFLSKTMQALMKSGLVESQQGVKGGYLLTKEPENINLMEIINATEERIGIVDCLNGDEEECIRNNHCVIKDPMLKIQKLIDKIFIETSLQELATGDLEKFSANGKYNTLIEIESLI
ncbi:MAG: Rrf2 family transcriptional regulator [Candidatus Kapaibacterium sp.]|jgi:Rrf2 family protein|nr:Rrf2 family transcriptional regulator [Candidatus Kapabacteria bacterium]